MEKPNIVRFGVVGTNFITDWIIEASKDEKRFELTAIYSRTQERANEYAAKYNIPNTFISLEEMAQSDLIDAVYIASPNAFHAPQSLLFMEYGKHVLCEKPLASNAKEAQEMIALAKNNNLVLMEAMKSTLTPNFKVVIDNLYKVGRIRQYFASYCQFSSRYEKYKAGIYVNAFDPKLSNGAVLDIGIYTIYPMVVLFGKPDEIKAELSLMSTGTDASGSVSFKYKNGLTATIIYSKVSDSILPTEIQGENGNLVLDRIHTIKKVEFIQGGVPTMGKGMQVKPENLSTTTLYNEYFYELKEFIDLIQIGQMESSINSHRNSLIVLEIIDTIRSQAGIVFPADLA